MQLSITEFGAAPGTRTPATQAIQEAIDECARAGGGQVIVPAGRFLTGTIQLRSFVDLMLENGAVLVASTDLRDYRDSGFEHVDNHFSQGEGGRSTSLIYALGEQSVGVHGSGAIDLSGDAFFDFSKVKPIAGVDESRLSPTQLLETSVPKTVGPTQPIFFSNCKQVTISGVRILDSPSLTINLNACSDVRIHHISILDNPRVPISDGIHICASRDVLISDCVFVCGDDCVAITGVTNWNDVSERIHISNCSMRSSSAGVRIGYRAGKIRDVVISNLSIHDSSRGFAVFVGDGGFVENVSIQNVVMHTRIIAGDWWGKGEPLAIFAPNCSGHIRHIRVKGLIARCENGAFIIGDRKNVSDVVLDDWAIELARGPNHELFGDVMDLQPVGMLPIKAGTAPWLTVRDAAGIRISNIAYRAAHAPAGKLAAAAVYDDADVVAERDVREC